jgi:hypothetical protein
VDSKLPSLPNQTIFEIYDRLFISRSTNYNGSIQHGSEDDSTKEQAKGKEKRLRKTKPLHRTKFQCE